MPVWYDRWCHCDWTTTINIQTSLFEAMATVFGLTSEFQRIIFLSNWFGVLHMRIQHSFLPFSIEEAPPTVSCKHLLKLQAPVRYQYPPTLTWSPLDIRKAVWFLSVTKALPSTFGPSCIAAIWPQHVCTGDNPSGIGDPSPYFPNSSSVILFKIIWWNQHLLSSAWHPNWTRVLLKALEERGLSPTQRSLCPFRTF